MNSEILLTIKLHDNLFVDPKRIKLLKAIDESGSISQAAKLAKVSYKSAWDHLEAMNVISPKPLLERNTGGKNGGGSRLTGYAERLLQLYDLLEQTQQKAFEILQDEQIPLNSLLSATAKFAPQSSARNQFFGKVAQLHFNNAHCDVEIDIADFPQNLTACITAGSAKRLNLSVGKEVMLMIKAPWVQLHHSKPHSPNCLPAHIVQINEHGEQQELQLKLGTATECYATVNSRDKFELGTSVWITIDPEQIVLLSL